MTPEAPPPEREEIPVRWFLAMAVISAAYAVVNALHPFAGLMIGAGGFAVLIFIVLPFVRLVAWWLGRDPERWGVAVLSIWFPGVVVGMACFLATTLSRPRDEREMKVWGTCAAAVLAAYFFFVAVFSNRPREATRR